MTNNRERILQLKKDGTLPAADLRALVSELTADEEELLYASAREVREAVYGKAVYLRGLIEFTNWCRNDCYYCGIRRSNRCADRYRLTEEQILDCADRGYRLGFRTIVLQGGEDPYPVDRREVQRELSGIF